MRPTSPPGSRERDVRSARLRALPLVAGLLVTGCASASRDEPSGPLDSSASEVRLVDLELRKEHRLVLRGFDGPMTVSASKQRTPRLVAHLETLATDAAEARSMLREIRLDVERSGSKFILRLERPNEHFVTRSSYDLAIPDRLSVKLNTTEGDVRVSGAFLRCEAYTGSGSIHVNGVRGGLRIENSFGDIVIEDIQGDRSRVHTNHGLVKIADCTFTRLEATSLHGDLQIRSLEAQYAALASSHGSIEIDSFRGTLRAQTGSGLVSLLDAEGEEFFLEAKNGQVQTRRTVGSLEIAAPAADTVVEESTGPLTVTSKYGAIRASGVFHELRAETSSGEIEIVALAPSSPTNRWVISNQYGNIDVTLPPAIACELDARTTYGTIRSEFSDVVESAYQRRSERVTTVVNGGGETVLVRSLTGRVRLHRASGGTGIEARFPH